MKQLILIQTDSNDLITPQGIDLSDSFILDWKKGDSEFEIEIELSIWPESPYYSKPLPNEHTCYKKGKINFYGLKEILGFVALESVSPNIDPDGSKDWECIYDFRKENERFKFRTEFTNIEISCSGLEIEIIE